MAGNKILRAARAAKKDEFYTQLPDIEKELRHYKRHFRDKTVLCNCDDPFESNFFKYFALNFNHFGLHKLVATCYAAGRGQGNGNKPYKAVVTAARGGGAGALDVAGLFRGDGNGLTELQGDGDFRSGECLALMDKADIVATNPPFSLFREYVAVLMKHEKKFIVLGNQNAITYKEIFPLLQNNLMWCGYYAGDMAFKVPADYEPRKTRYWRDGDGQKWRSMGNICWFTNLDIEKRHDEMLLARRYHPDAYPRYDNYDAIEVSQTANIPFDYPGVMGVPITFLDKYNPDQFEIVGITTAAAAGMQRAKRYKNAVQHNKDGTQASGSKVNTRAAILSLSPPAGKVYYTADNADGYLEAQYPRILIRNKRPGEERRMTEGGMA